MAKILVVEDDPILQKTLSEVLEREGFEVFSAGDGELAIRLAKEKLPDLILLDIIVPKKSGFEVLEAVKEDEKTKEAKVIMLTNLEGSADISRALDLGASSYVVKADSELDYIVAMVRNLLSINK
jgi:two-component system, OmpR family, alkaline phosphatase synthesis response regulator PhoP